MTALLSFLLVVLVSPFRSNSSLLAENGLLRYRVTVLGRKTKGRISLTNGAPESAWQIAQARLRRRPIQRRQIHDQAAWPRDQGWRTFLRNRAFEIAAMDLLVVPTIGFGLLYAFTVPRGAEWAGNIVCRPILGGLHHQYGRM